MNYGFSSPSEYFLTTSKVLIRVHSGMENCWVNHFNSKTITCGDAEGWVWWACSYRASSANVAGNRRLWHRLGGCLPVRQQKSYAFCFQVLIIKYTIPSQGFENFAPNAILENLCCKKDVFGKLFATGFVTAPLFNLNQHIGWNLTQPVA